ncbi:hypothetical protein EV143_12013 [Flavobacterium chryseum]|uniref:hypothetical protein n=1 Tax=Flavobacterium sp. P3160 TaxID=2512113 RepID=UPI00105E8768|nr:hypothetical protein [Flavobacterium sp. P3160]TDO68751.1 hypothetical protein EV143_12013 [Flavobacterium sp. P3160]
MIEIVNGRVFVEGKETVDPALIGYAVLDLAEDNQNATLHPITDKNLLSMINNQVELNLISQLAENEALTIPLFADGMSYQAPFYVNWPSTHILYNIIERIKNGRLIFKDHNQGCTGFSKGELVFIKK